MNASHIVTNYNLNEKNDYTFELWYNKHEKHLQNLFEIFKNEFLNEIDEKNITFDNFCCFIFEKSSNSI
tara:strand:- start:464 stop:670 length:207 start_codon:yes stop_codon:yes gene_type:complete